MNCVFMGYFHSDVNSTDIDNDMEITGFSPAEFAIPYMNSINKNYMDFIGPVALNRAVGPPDEIKIKLEKRKLINRKTESKSNKKLKTEGGTKSRRWSMKYKRSINCKRPRGFSQRQHCKYGRKTRKNNN